MVNGGWRRQGRAGGQGQHGALVLGRGVKVSQAERSIFLLFKKIY